MKLSELNVDQKNHLARQLDSKTTCGLLTATAVVRGKHGDLDLIDIFITYGERSRRSALAHARLVEKFVLDPDKRIVSDKTLTLFRMVQLD